MPQDSIQIDENLVLRAATIADAEKVAKLNEYVHGNPEKGELEKSIGAWTHDLFSGYNPEIQPSDWTVVEDTSTGEIVSDMCLMGQVWNVGGVDVSVGQIEIVGTHPDYRRRGLIRKQFELMHDWSNARGHLITTVLGIPNYYRQFGYEMGIDGEGGSLTNLDFLKRVKAESSDAERFTWRDATPADLEAISSIYANIKNRAFITVNRDASIIEKELFKRSDDHPFNWRARILQSNGKAAACYFYAVEQSPKVIRVDMFEIGTGVNWNDATRNFAIDLQSVLKANTGDEQESGLMVKIDLSPNHPIYKILGDPLGTTSEAYSWYFRAPDLPKLVYELRPIFEERLSGSVFDSYSGDLNLSFYGDGLKIVFDEGRIVSTDSARFERDQASALFPDLTFLQVLFGNRTLRQLKETRRDAYASSRAMESLIDVLFGPRKPAAILQVS